LVAKAAAAEIANDAVSSAAAAIAPSRERCDDPCAPCDPPCAMPKLPLWRTPLPP
jgi:hypothetical protein